jgi:hypothetical protein
MLLRLLLIHQLLRLLRRYGHLLLLRLLSLLRLLLLHYHRGDDAFYASYPPLHLADLLLLLRPVIPLLLLLQLMPNFVIGSLVQISIKLPYSYFSNISYITF